MKYLIFTFLFCFAASSTAIAQTVVKGYVYEKTNNVPINRANVLIKTSEGKLLTYGYTDSDGHFSINLNTQSTKLQLQITKIGFKTYIDVLGNAEKPLIIKMEEGALQLKEVTVKPNRIQEQGDTITYFVGSFAQKQDRTIGDVLKHMPGIDITDNGKIKYQGNDINKFYIEGNDLLGGKYGIATNGIAYEDIGSVEVMENHQPMQVLRGLSFSDQAAINLKMKDNSKATLLAHGTLTGGWSQQPKGGLWQAEIFTMMAKERYQMITTFKNNNTGLNLSDQLIDFTADRSDESSESYTSLSTPSAPNIQSNRSYFNRSWQVSTSHLLKTKKGGEFKAQVDYNNDRISRNDNNTTTYFLESGNKVVLEDKNSLSHRNAITGKFSFEINEKNYFLYNTLSTDVSWNSLNLSTIGSLLNDQDANMPQYSVVNLLKMIKRLKNNKLVTITSHNEWNSMPEKLTITHDEKSYGQRIKQNSFYTDERASLGFVLKRILLSLEVGMSGYFRNFDTKLWGLEFQDLTENEKLTTDYLRIYANPKFEWNNNKIELTLKSPINLYNYFFSSGLKNRTELFISPTVSARYRFSPRMSLALSGSLRRSPALLHNIYNASILTDYRTFRSGLDDYYTSFGQNLSIAYNYRNALKGFFFMVMGSYGWNKSKFGTVQNFVGNYILYSYRSQPTDSRNAVVFLNLSKTLDFMRGSVGLRSVYQKGQNSILSEEVKTDYRNNSYSLSPFVNGNISSILNWDLRFTWNRSSLKISNIDPRNVNNFTYTGSITITPCPLITWTASGEFYHNQIESSRYKDILLFDTKLTFNVNKQIEISASATNLFNKRNYSYTTYGTLLQCEHSTLLRGRELMVSIYIKK